MPQFSQRKRSKELWHSLPFYSEPGGYKLCLQVAANGVGAGKGTRVRVRPIDERCTRQAAAMAVSARSDVQDTQLEEKRTAR